MYFCHLYFYHWLRTAAELLKKGARTGIKDDDGKTPLHCATSYGHFETVKLLINNQADIDSAYVKRCVLLACIATHYQVQMCKK